MFQIPISWAIPRVIPTVIQLIVQKLTAWNAGFKKSKADVHIDQSQQILITQNKKYLKTETTPNCKVIYVPGKFDSINFNYQIMTICDLIRLHYFQQYYL